MTKETRFTACLIGEDSLLTHCGDFLRQEGHTLVAVISPVAAIGEWARTHQVPYFSAVASAFDYLEAHPFDYLFSLINRQVLSKAVLALPQKLAINYHDAPLPRYAGVHATAWALFNGEKTHGITWHLITDVIDGGDILDQRTFSIAESETTLSLNLTCLKHALEAFHALVKALIEDTYTRTPQALTQRTYYGLHQKPPAQGWIDWHLSAEQIDRLCRACAMGDYPNAWSSAKFLLADHTFLLHKTQVLPQKSSALPGTVVHVADDQWHLATATHDIALLAITHGDGTPAHFSQLAQHYSLRSGTVLTSPSRACQARLEKTSVSLSEHEKFWVTAWETFKPTPFSFLSCALSSESESASPDTEKMHYPTTWSISPRLQAALASAWGCEIPLSDVLLTTWLVYLSRVSSSETPGVLIPCARVNENEPNEANPAGEWVDPSASLLPFSISLTEELCFHDALRRVRTHRQTLQLHGSYLPDIFSRYPHLASLATSAFILVLLPANKPEARKEEGRAEAFSPTPLLTLTWGEEGKTLTFSTPRGMIAKNPELKVILNQIPGHLETMLQAAMADKTAKITTLPLLTAQEYQTLLVEWNRTETDYPKHHTLMDVFEAQVQKNPDAIAVTFESTSLTYAELNQRAHTLAVYLQERGVTVETPVGICAGRGIEMIIAMLAILKAGGAYVPIDPDYPEMRIQSMLKDSGVTLLLTADLIHDVLKNSSVATLTPVNITPLNLAYIMYTSGSTGQPKGIEIMHQGVVRLVKNTNYIHLTPHDKIAHISNPAFDAATFEIWGALLNGASTVIFSKNDVLTPDIFQKKLMQHSITTLWLTASLFNQFIQSYLTFPKELQNLLIGGEPLSVKSVRQLLNTPQRPPNILNGYGPTENTTFTTYYHIKNISVWSTSVAIGRPISNTQVYVLDKNKQPLPMGFEGELYIGGEGVARGYRNNPSLTQHTFIENPFSKNTASRLYKTGDLVRWLPSGNLEFIGRIDDQLKIRGFRVDPAEIETVLAQCPSVSQSKVLLQKNTLEDRHLLIAFLVPQQKLSLHALKDFLKNKLPSYMIPAYFYEIEHLPLTANGKVDTIKLLTLSQTQVPLKSSDFTPPSTPAQKILQTIWCDLFHTEVSISDDFFDLGGDSILAIQMCAKAKEQGMDLTVRAIFDFPTLAQLALQLTSPSDVKNKVCTPPSGLASLTPIQHWFFAQGFTHPAQFSQIGVIHLSPDVDLQTLTKALHTLFSHHDVFRVRFSSEKKKWVPRVTSRFPRPHRPPHRLRRSKFQPRKTQTA